MEGYVVGPGLGQYQQAGAGGGGGSSIARWSLLNLWIDVLAIGQE